MEDSEQRKKRLKEMRLEADLAEDSGGGGGGAEGSGIPSLLSNPLAEEAPSNMLSQNKSYAAPRFNYYTDPMNAFSSDKRSSVNVHPGPDYLPPMPHFSSPHLESTNRQMPPSPTQALPTSYRNPVWNGPRGPPQYNFPFRPSGGGIYPSPRFESPSCPSFNSAPVMNHWPNQNPNPAPAYMNNPHFSQGRGRGFWNNNTRSPDSGRGRGRGSSSHGRWSNEDRGHVPNRFYKMSMVEDPWKFLKPIIWNSTYSSYSNTAYTPENSKPWIPSKSTSTKQEESPAVFSKVSSGPSLAEYLASALNEASSTEENV